jgi:hypothetical protein
MKRLTSLTAGDAMRSPHYIHGPGVKKDDLLQRLGKLEDAIEQINGIIIGERNPVTALRKAGDVIADLDRGHKKKVEW